jgi:hypothetical protein
MSHSPERTPVAKLRKRRGKKIDAYIDLVGKLKNTAISYI